MEKNSWKIAFAYIGVIIGAGLSSGQDLLQYFLGFGKIGLVAVVILGILNALFGKIMLTLGCYYRADNHEEVFSQIAHPIITRFIDIVLVIGSFVMGFVMVAGAGSNLNQQFGIPSWLGALICSIFIVIVSFLDFDKITNVLGFFTPVMIVMIFLVAIYTFWGKSYNFTLLDISARTISPAISNVWLSVINYYSLCAITGVSMAFILGGSVVRIGVAEKGGMVGGILIGSIVLLASFSLFAHINQVKDSDMPMLTIVNNIHPILAILYAMTVFALIFNTAFSLYYSIAKRFASNNNQKIKIIMIIIVLTGYACSFMGFKKLIGLMYPILGYMGILLLFVLLIGWIKERGDIISEKFFRRKMIRISLKKQNPLKEVSKEEKKLFNKLGEISSAEAESLKKDIHEVAAEIIENNKDIKAYSQKNISVDDELLNQSIIAKEEKQNL